MKTRTLFNFGYANRLGIVPVVADDDWDQMIAIGVSGRIFGHYISLSIPWRKRI